MHKKKKNIAEKLAEPDKMVSSVLYRANNTKQKVLYARSFSQHDCKHKHKLHTLTHSSSTPVPCSRQQGSVCTQANTAVGVMFGYSCLRECLVKKVLYINAVCFFQQGCLTIDKYCLMNAI